MGCTKESGTCKSCQSACVRKPGWFKPSEAEAVAEYLGVSIAELFADKLAVDWWCGDGVNGGDIFVLSPALVGEDAGTEFPGDPEGQCVFYLDGKCSIHSVKPYECAEALPCDHDRGRNYHKEAADAWNTEKHQTQIAELLGRKPESTDYGGGSIFSLLGIGG